jgi:hypothetical protein
MADRRTSSSSSSTRKVYQLGRVLGLYAGEPDVKLLRRLWPFVMSAAVRVDVAAALWPESRIWQLRVDDGSVLVRAA